MKNFKEMTLNEIHDYQIELTIELADSAAYLDFLQKEHSELASKYRDVTDHFVLLQETEESKTATKN